MYKFKLFLLAALCAAAIGGLTETQAQTSTGKVLVSCEQTFRAGDVDSIIDNPGRSEVRRLPYY